MNGPETMLDILWISSYIFITRSPYTQTIYGLDTGTSLVAQLVKNPPTNAGHACKVGSILHSGRPWRRKWQLTPVFLPGKFHGQKILVD